MYDDVLLSFPTSMHPLINEGMHRGWKYIVVGGSDAWLFSLCPKLLECFKKNQCPKLGDWFSN
jgi:hypothetical protein